MPVPNSEPRRPRHEQSIFGAKFFDHTVEHEAKYKQQSEKGYQLDLAEIRHTIATAPSGPDYYIGGTEKMMEAIFMDMTTLLYITCSLGTPAEKGVNQSIRRQQRAKERGRCSHRNTRMRKLRDRKRAAGDACVWLSLYKIYTMRTMGHTSSVVRKVCHEIIEFGKNVKNLEEVDDFCDSVMERLLQVPKTLPPVPDGVVQPTLSDDEVFSILPFMFKRICMSVDNSVLDQYLQAQERIELIGGLTTPFELSSSVGGFGWITPSEHHFDDKGERICKCCHEKNKTKPNAKCPCGSKKKYKKCCQRKDQIASDE